MKTKMNHLYACSLAVLLCASGSTEAQGPLHIEVNSSGDANPPPSGVVTLRSALESAAPHAGRAIITINPYLRTIDLKSEILLLGFDGDLKLTSNGGCTIRKASDAVSLGGEITLSFDGGKVELENLIFERTIMTLNVSEVRAENCHFKGQTDVAAPQVGGFGINNHSGAHLTVTLQNCIASDTEEDGIQILDFGGGNLEVNATVCTFGNNSDDGLELDEKYDGNLSGLLSFCSAAGCHVNFNLSEHNSGYLNINVQACVASFAEDANIEFKEFDQGNNMARANSVIAPGSKAREGIEIKEQGDGGINVDLSFIHASGAETHGIKVHTEDQETDSDCYVSTSNNRCHFNKSHGLEIDVVGTLAFSDDDSRYTLNVKHGIHIDKDGHPDGVNTDLVHEGTRLANNGKDGIHADFVDPLDHVKAIFRDCVITANNDDGIALEVSHGSNEYSMCYIHGVLAHYQGNNDRNLILRPLAPNPNFPDEPDEYLYWKTTQMTRDLL